MENADCVFVCFQVAMRTPARLGCLEPRGGESEARDSSQHTHSIAAVSLTLIIISLRADEDRAEVVVVVVVCEVER